MEPGRTGRITLVGMGVAAAVGAGVGAALALHGWWPAQSTAHSVAGPSRPHLPPVFAGTRPFGAGDVPPRTFGWPVRPFDRPHVIRATFGEPRGLVRTGMGAGGARREYLLTHAGNKLLRMGHRVIHTGIDVVARDGTRVYAVESGVAHRGGDGWDRFVVVGHFGYWHLAHPVPSGTRVRAFHTVIGTVYPGQGHVHLTRFARLGGIDAVNPLVHGGPVGFRDTAAPVMGALVAYDRLGLRVPLDRLHQPVALAVQAADIQSRGGTETGVYRLTYALRRRGASAPLFPPITTFRFDRLPTPSQGDVAYTLASTRHHFNTRFWYRLTDRGPTRDGSLHFEDMPPGRYVLRVTAADASGNTTTVAFALRVRPAPTLRAPH